MAGSKICANCGSGDTLANADRWTCMSCGQWTLMHDNALTTGAGPYGTAENTVASDPPE